MREEEIKMIYIKIVEIEIWEQEYIKWLDSLIQVEEDRKIVVEQYEK